MSNISNKMSVHDFVHEYHKIDALVRKLHSELPATLDDFDSWSIDKEGMLEIRSSQYYTDGTRDSDTEHVPFIRLWEGGIEAAKEYITWAAKVRREEVERIAAEEKKAKAEKEKERRHEMYLRLQEEFGEHD